MGYTVMHVLAESAFFIVLLYFAPPATEQPEWLQVLILGVSMNLLRLHIEWLVINLGNIMERMQ